MAEKVSRRLVILSAAATAAVYAAGYRETRAADAQLAGATTTVGPTAAAPSPADASTVSAPGPASTPMAGATAAPTFPTASSTGVQASTGGGQTTTSLGTSTVRVGSVTLSGSATAPAAATPAQAARPSSAQPGAPATPAPVATPAPSATIKQAASTGYKDGTYPGSGTSRRGGIVVAVTIQGGRIARVAITQSTTQYPVSRISGLPAEVVDRQGAQVDLVTGATFSSLAFQGAVQQALAEARVA